MAKWLLDLIGLFHFFRGKINTKVNARHLSLTSSTLLLYVREFSCVYRWVSLALVNKMCFNAFYMLRPYIKNMYLLYFHYSYYLKQTSRKVFVQDMIALNSNVGLSWSVLQRAEKVLSNFSLQDKKLKILIYLFPCRQLTPNFAAEDYWLGEWGTVTTKWETTHCDKGDLRVLQLTAVEEWLAQVKQECLNSSSWPLIPNQIKMQTFASLKNTCKHLPVYHFSSQHTKVTAFQIIKL